MKIRITNGRDIYINDCKYNTLTETLWIHESDKDKVRVISLEIGKNYEAVNVEIPDDIKFYYLCSMDADNCFISIVQEITGAYLSNIINTEYPKTNTGDIIYPDYKADMDMMDDIRSKGYTVCITNKSEITG